MPSRNDQGSHDPRVMRNASCNPRPVKSELGRLLCCEVRRDQPNTPNRQVTRTVGRGMERPQGWSGAAMDWGLVIGLRGLSGEGVLVCGGLVLVRWPKAIERVGEWNKSRQVVSVIVPGSGDSGRLRYRVQG